MMVIWHLFLENLSHTWKISEIKPTLPHSTGVVLIVTLTIMFVCSLPFVRRSGHFEYFYFTHLLYYVYFVAIILHAEHAWKWICVPLGLFMIERIYLSLSILKKFSGGSDSSSIQAGIILPSKTTSLIIKKPDRFKHHVGDWVFIKIPAVARYVSSLLTKYVCIT